MRKNKLPREACRVVLDSMNSKFVALLILVSASYAQMISLGPFTLLESMKEAKAHCRTMDLERRVSMMESYIVDCGRGLPFKLLFDLNRDQLTFISIIADNSTYSDYLDIVNRYTNEVVQRSPDNMWAPSSLPGYGTIWWWKGRTDLTILYFPKKERTTITLKMRLID